jgi:hypothetical protein
MKQKLLLLSSLAGLLVTTGCKKNFESINTDPEHITSTVMNYNYLFTAAEQITSGNSDGNAYEDWRNNLIYSGCMVQHLSSTVGYWDGDKYLFNASYASAYWDNNYPNTVTNIVEVLAHTKGDTSQSNFYNIAHIWHAFMFQRMTDMYGDCPYTQAGLGYISGITAPVYDKQQVIYDSLFVELQTAALALDPSKPNTVGTADLVYGGNVAEWQKFAYSEILRLAMRLVKVDPATAQKWITVAVQGGLMASNSDNALIAHNAQINQTCNGSAFVLTYDDPNASRLSETFVNYLKSTQDPRLIYLGTVSTNPGGQFTTAGYDYGDTSYALQLGQPNGYDLSGGTTDISTSNNWPSVPHVTTPDSVSVYQNRYSIVNRYTYAQWAAPSFMLTYSETELLLAEAAARGWVSQDPATLYANGVTAAMQQLTSLNSAAVVSQSQISAYLAANPYTAGSGIEQINNQIWVATFMDENEAWENWRRSGYPSLTPVNYPGNATNGTIPRRFTYPVGEASTNTTNYNAAVADLSPAADKMDSRMWWDSQ